MTDTLTILTLRALGLACRDRDSRVRLLARNAIREWQELQRLRGAYARQIFCTVIKPVPAPIYRGAARS
jgi:hypothetical protein